MMEIELRKLADTIKSIHEEMYYLRERYKYCLLFLAVLKLRDLSFVHLVFLANQLEDY
jgi:hypothetical protein